MPKNDEYTITGTNIAEVKRQNEESGLTYNQVKSLLSNQFQLQKTSSTSSTNPENK